MNVKILLVSMTMAAAVAAGGCKQSKSTNPLSPSVAGPIPGVTITAPRLLSPTPGTQIENAAQPVTLTFENASTSGQRPLTYLIEVAMDADFNNKLLSRDGVAPGGNGQTAFRLPDALAADRTYYWRVRAQDGANTGPYTSGVNFTIYTPIVLQAPGLMSPINDTQTGDRNPTLVLNNAGRSGPVGAIIYEMQVSSNEAFSAIVDSMEQAEQPGSTRKAIGVTLNYDTRYFWRARAWEMTKNMPGPWSGTATFRTPPAPVVAPPPPSGGGGGGGGGGRQGHITGALTEDLARQIVYGTADEFPNLLGVFGSDSEAEGAAFELLLRTIWHLQLAGFQAGRQQNPSGRISEDKLTIFIGGAWHAYDVSSVAGGRRGNVSFMEVWPASYVPSAGLAD
jgi:hypothetical protein